MHELVTVAVFDTLPKADLARSLLEQEGILCVLTDGNLVAMDWLLSNAVGGIKVQVPSSEADRAKEFLANFLMPKAAQKTDGPAIRFSCSECGQAVEFPSSRAGGVETCPACKNYIDVPENESEGPA